MDKYNDLELNIISCILVNPELMNTTILEDKYFTRHKNFWLFMKAFYKRFGNFDLSLMYDVCPNNWKLVMYIERIVDLEFFPSRFKEYEKRLIEKFNESEKDKWIIEKVYEEVMNLVARNTNVNDFKEKVNIIYDNAIKLYDKTS